MFESECIQVFFIGAAYPPLKGSIGMMKTMVQSRSNRAFAPALSARRILLPLAIAGSLFSAPVCNAQNYVFEKTFGGATLSYPNGVVVDASGYAYVADTFNNQIVKFDPLGAITWTAGGPANSPSTLSYPSGLALDSLNNIFVANSAKHNIVKFDSSGTYLSYFGEYGGAIGQFNTPYALKVDPNNNIYVADTLNSRVQKFDASGAFLQSFGSNGTGNGQLRNAGDVAVDSSGNVYVTDLDNERIVKFNSSSAYVSLFGNSGTLDTQVSSAGGIVLDSRGDVFVSAPNIYQRVQKYSPSGSYLSYFGSFGSGSGQFYNCEGLSFDTTGRLYVADSFNNRIEVFLPVVSNYGVSISVTRGGFTYNSATKHFIQKVTLTNTSSTAVPGAISLVLTGLSSNATLNNATGTTVNLSPLGSPYLNSVGSLAPQASVILTLDFLNPSKAAITYTTAIYAGPGYR